MDTPADAQGMIDLGDRDVISLEAFVKSWQVLLDKWLRLDDIVIIHEANVYDTPAKDSSSAQEG